MPNEPTESTDPNEGEWKGTEPQPYPPVKDDPESNPDIEPDVPVKDDPNKGTQKPS